MSKNSFFTISLDFELFWGVRDVATMKGYGENILGVRKAIPAILNLFRSYQIRATWATVGMVTFSTRKELISSLPTELPAYLNSNLDPYRHLSNIGENEHKDPYHYGYSLVRAIQETPGMEIASHTFSHFYCLEANSNPLSFKADLEASFAALKNLGVDPRTLVFCRNQYDKIHLSEAFECGFEVFRGNETGYLYRPRSREDENLIRRAGRLLDAYVNISGANLSNTSLDEAGVINVPSSRFLRPVGWGYLEEMRLKRILSSMESAAKASSGFHLWWHPHNFGKNLEKNLAFLEEVLKYFRYLQEKYDMQSLSMSEASDLLKLKKASNSEN